LNEFAELHKLLKTLDAVRHLADPDRFRERAEALDRLDAFHLDAEASIDSATSGELALHRRARELRAELEDANSRFYESIRDAIRRGTGREALLQCAVEAAGPRAERTTSSDEGDSYDYLDELVSGVFQFVVADAPKIDLSSEMVAYQPTPVRHVFEMIHRTNLAANDVFVDLGSGLGHVPLLVAVCTPARTVGIEVEPSYVECARQSAADLQMRNASFIAQDVRDADLSSGTVFYLYTPFRGAILRAVLDRLRAEANTRAIRVCTFGPCLPSVAAESWLALDSTESGQISVFRSRQ
jgi:Histone methylation protein DOT1